MRHDGIWIRQAQNVMMAKFHSARQTGSHSFGTRQISWINNVFLCSFPDFYFFPGYTKIFIGVRHSDSIEKGVRAIIQCEQSDG